MVVEPTGQPGAIVRPARRCFFSGVIAKFRQVSAPSAGAWLFDLTDTRGPLFVVLRVTDRGARDALAQHLVDAGVVSDLAQGEHLLDDADPVSVGVVW